jgi:hypothetical protein
LLILPDDSVGLPIADAPRLSDGLRALTDAATAYELASALIGSVTLAPLFAVAQVMMKIAAHTLVSIDILIDALVADTDMAL